MLRDVKFETRIAPRSEGREEVWCINCKGQGHDKEHCLVFANYVVVGGPIPLRPEVQARPSATPAL